ncbi:MAG TPA: hypothetical protein VGO11_00210 [Chthoniobacteraceae bacterium]|jgi:hypothetical protein|nr:hypothetical protein [Chthoniobacteraceae bacterium]
MRRSLLLFTLLLTGACARGQVPVEPKPPLEVARPNVVIELHCLSLPQALAVPLVRRLRSGDVAEQSKVMAELEQMVLAGKVTLQGWLIATTHDGEKATAEDNEELRFATEFTPTQADVYLADKDGDISPQPDKVKVDSVPTATAFDVRNTGVTLEVEPRIAADKKSLEINLIAQHCRLKSVDRMIVEREFTTEKKSQKTIVEQPRFTNFKVNSYFSMKSGEHRLVGIFRGPEGEKTLELFILGVELLEAK